jgi:hypothetical protein
MPKKELGYTLETKSTPKQIEQREKIAKLFRNHPMPDEHLLVSLGLYMRSSALVKILFLNELYELIMDVPGVIIEFGVWWGQNLVIFENLRAIYEPFNQTRRVIGFDTFSGYASFSDKDRTTKEASFSSYSDVLKKGGYSVSEGYRAYLDELISAHEGTNVLGNIRRHTLVEGDVVKTAPQFFKDNPETVVALAYFDLALYEPTKACLQAIRPHLIPGSVIVLDEFNYPEAPGETIAFKEVFKDVKYTIKKSKYITDKSIVFIK